jgi:hypothetical protein
VVVQVGGSAVGPGDDAVVAVARGGRVVAAGRDAAEAETLGGLAPGVLTLGLKASGWSLPGHKRAGMEPDRAGWPEAGAAASEGGWPHFRTATDGSGRFGVTGGQGVAGSNPVVPTM